MEILVTLIVFGILSFYALASYEHWVIKSRRTEAVTGLLQRAALLERCYAAQLDYRQCAPELSNLPDAGKYYSYSIKIEEPHTYLLSAQPLTSQQADSACGVYGLNALNQQSNSGSLAAGECW